MSSDEAYFFIIFQHILKETIDCEFNFSALDNQTKLKVLKCREIL